MHGLDSRWKRYRAPLAVLMITCSLGLSGCGWNPFASHPTPTTILPEETQEDVTPQKEVSIFFSHGTSGEMADVTRSLPTELRREPIRFAVGELLKGPRPEEKKQGFYSEIPAGTQLLGVNRHGSTLNIELSKKFASGGGSTSILQRVEELKRTVYALDRRRQLRVSIEGKPLDILGGEGLEVNDSLKRQIQ
jgi:spore germination protein GerM